MIANFNENSSDSEYQLSSAIQGTSKGIESKRGETSRSRKILNKRKVRRFVKYLVQ